LVYVTGPLVYVTGLFLIANVQLLILPLEYTFQKRQSLDGIQVPENCKTDKAYREGSISEFSDGTPTRTCFRELLLLLTGTSKEYCKHTNFYKHH
jgi:hypothetical protein